MIKYQEQLIGFLFLDVAWRTKTMTGFNKFLFLSLQTAISNASNRRNRHDTGIIGKGNRKAHRRFGI